MPKSRSGDSEGKTSSEPPKYDLRINEIRLLGNITEDYVTGFTIQLTTPMLSQEFRRSLMALLKENKGNVPLNMVLYDPEHKYNITFHSKKFQVGINSEFIQQVRDMGLGYKVNVKQ